MKLGMKQFVMLLLCIGLFASTAEAQKLSKQEKKEWKKKAKEFKKNPAALKDLSEGTQAVQAEMSQLQSQSQTLQQENASLKSDNTLKTDRIASLQQQVNDLTMELQNARLALQSQPSEVETSAEGLRGIIYRVQIGAYKNKQIEDDLVTTENLSLEQQEDLQKIVVGQFRDYNRAQELRANLTKIGIKGAWIVSYRDGVRIPIEEARRQ